MREKMQQPGGHDAHEQRLAALAAQHAEHAGGDDKIDVVYPSQVPTRLRNVEKFAELVARQLDQSIDTCRAGLMALIDNKLSRALQDQLQTAAIEYRRTFWRPFVQAKIEHIHARIPYPISQSRVMRYILATLDSRVENPKTGDPTDWKEMLEVIANELLQGNPKLVDEPEDEQGPTAPSGRRIRSGAGGGRHVNRGTKYKS